MNNRKLCKLIYETWEFVLIISCVAGSFGFIIWKESPIKGFELFSSYVLLIYIIIISLIYIKL